MHLKVLLSDGITTTKPTNKWKLYDGLILWFSLMSEEGGLKPGQEPIPKGMLRCCFGVMQPFLQVQIRMSFLLYHKFFKE